MDACEHSNELKGSVMCGGITVQAEKLKAFQKRITVLAACSTAVSGHTTNTITTVFTFLKQKAPYYVYTLQSAELSYSNPNLLCCVRILQVANVQSMFTISLRRFFLTRQEERTDRNFRITVTMKIAIFWNVMPCSLLEVNRRFG